jgi:hypothetical protein
MYTAKLRAVGGSVMFAIPKPMLDGLDLQSYVLSYRQSLRL